MTANDGGPAFPSGEVEDNFNENKHAMFTGMSLRDWFAGQALVGLAGMDLTSLKNEEPDVVLALMARSAYVLADAMLAERMK